MIDHFLLVPPHLELKLPPIVVIDDEFILLANATSFEMTFYRLLEFLRLATSELRFKSEVDLRKELLLAPIY